MTETPPPLPAPAEEAPGEPATWRRPNPVTMAVLAITFLTSNGLPLLALLVVGGGGVAGELVLAAIGLASSVVAGFTQWWFTRYAVTEHAIELRAGVFQRRDRRIPFDRIQQVTVDQPVVARIFGMAAVDVREASADGEVAVKYLSVAQANELMIELRALARRAGAAPSTPDSSDPMSAAEDPAAPGPPRRIVHRSSGGTIARLTLAGGAPFTAAAFVVAVALGVATAATDLAINGAAFAVVIVAVVLATVGPAVNEALSLGDFSLSVGERGLFVDAGLLSRRHVEIEPTRIQTVTIESSPVARRVFDLHRVRFSAATGRAVTGAPVLPLSPAIVGSELPWLFGGTVGVDPMIDQPLQPVSRLTVRRVLVRIAVVTAVALVPVAIALATQGLLPVLVPLVGVIGVAAMVYARERHRRLGWNLVDGRLIVRRGVLTHQLTQLPLITVQSAERSASLFQRRLGLATVTANTAGVGGVDHVRIPDLVARDADELLAILSTAAASSRWEPSTR